MFHKLIVCEQYFIIFLYNIRDEFPNGYKQQYGMIYSNLSNHSNINLLSLIYFFICVICYRQRREGTTLKNVTPFSTAITSPVSLYGLRMEYSYANVEYDEQGVPQLLVQRNASFRLFGSGWTERTIFVLTEKIGHKGSPCEFPVGDVQEVCIIIFCSTHYLIE